MKCIVPEISWHNRDPILSLDFHYNDTDGFYRLATAGSDTHVLIWALKSLDNGGVNVEFIADLTRHSYAVNAVRFSPKGDFLASGDDEAAICLWKRVDLPDIFSEKEEEENKENWTLLKILRGHLNDVCDLNWSPDGNFLVSGSIDNTAILWDFQKGRTVKILSDSKGYVQGVSWDPLNQYIATLNSDRTCLVYSLTTHRVLHRIQKMNLPTNNTDGSQTNNRGTRMFHDETLKSFCRRLTFSPNGELLVTPAGIIENSDGKFMNTVYVFSRKCLNRPVIYFPLKEKTALVVKCCPVLFELRTKQTQQLEGSDKQPWDTCKTTFKLPYRIVIAVATQDSIFFYDTQQMNPFAVVSSIHYTRITDLSWSQNGQILAAASTDGYCSIITFGKDELGVPYKAPTSVPTSNLTTDNIKNEDSLNFSSKLNISNQQSPKPNVDSQNKSEPANKSEPTKRRVSIITLFSKSSMKNENVTNLGPKEYETQTKPDLIVIEDTNSNGPPQQNKNCTSEPLNNQENNEKGENNPVDIISRMASSPKNFKPATDDKKTSLKKLNTPKTHKFGSLLDMFSKPASQPPGKETKNVPKENSRNEVTNKDEILIEDTNLLQTEPMEIDSVENPVPIEEDYKDFKLVLELTEQSADFSAKQDSTNASASTKATSQKPVPTKLPRRVQFKTLSTPHK